MNSSSSSQDLIASFENEIGSIESQIGSLGQELRNLSNVDKALACSLTNQRVSGLGNDWNYIKLDLEATIRQLENQIKSN
jgi:hypothetical protein